VQNTDDQKETSKQTVILEGLIDPKPVKSFSDNVLRLRRLGGKSIVCSDLDCSLRVVFIFNHCMQYIERVIS
jgi:hypothetical protein